MLTSLRLFNYKGFREVEIPLSSMSILLGPNGAGKSTVGAALYSLSIITRSELHAAFPEGFYGFERTIHFDRDKLGYDESPIGLGISGKDGETTFAYDLFFYRKPDSADAFSILYEGLFAETPNGKTHYATGKPPNVNIALPTVGSTNWPSNITKDLQRNSIFWEAKNAGGEDNFSDLLNTIRGYCQTIKYQFSPAMVRMDCDAYDGSGRQPYLKGDGSNLAQVVQYFQEDYQSGLNQLRDWLIQYAKGTCHLMDVSVSNYEYKASLNFLEKGAGQTHIIKGPLQADGYWVFTAFAALAASPTLPSLCFFEEPESHLHPHKMDLLYELLKLLSKKKCQALISTHSPYLLDHCKQEPESVVFLNNGSAKRLTDIPHYQNILRDFSLGEAWYSNLLSWGNPA